MAGEIQVFNQNNLYYIDFNIFGDAESESAIIYHVLPIWELKLGPKRGGEIQRYRQSFRSK